MQNRSLPQLDELYKEIILDHYREPKGKVPVEHVDFQAEGMNPLCGDEIKLSLQLKGKVIDRVHVEGHGCSISVASGSMLADILKGKTIDEAKELSKYFKGVMHGKTNSHVITSETKQSRSHDHETDQDCHASLCSARNDNQNIDIGDLVALEGVKLFPVRIKCALLPWATFEEALDGHKHVEIS